MSPQDAAAFVARFAELRSEGGGHELWHPDGSLHNPFANRVIAGPEIAALNRITREQAPDLTWELLGWTHRDDVVVVEWTCTNRSYDQVIAFSGVDKLTVVDGLIVEEVVYADTAPFQAIRLGLTFEPLMSLPAHSIANY